MKKTLYIKLLIAYLIFAIFGFIIVATFMQQMKGGASELYSWIKENQSDIVQGYQFIQSIIKNHGELPIAESTQSAPLPPINE